MEMMEMMMYVVMEKDLRFETVTPIAVFQDRIDAEAFIEQMIDKHGYDYGYKIESVDLNPSADNF